MVGFAVAAGPERATFLPSLAFMATRLCACGLTWHVITKLVSVGAVTAFDLSAAVPAVGFAPGPGPAGRPAGPGLPAGCKPSSGVIGAGVTAAGVTVVAAAPEPPVLSCASPI